MKNTIKKITLFVFIWITLFLVVENPVLGFQVYSSETQQVSTLLKLNNGFVGSTLVFYSNSPIVNSTNSVIGYNVNITDFSFAGIFLLILPFIIVLCLNNTKKVTTHKHLSISRSTLMGIKKDT